MRIKTKLTLNVGLLFLMVGLVASIAMLKINSLASDSTNILIANYNSLDYSRKMLKALDDLHTEKGALLSFENNLKLQQANITEIGEAEITDNIVQHFRELKDNYSDTTVTKKIREGINEIMMLNMGAIERKSLIAATTAEDATIWIVITGTLCFVIAFGLLLNLPGDIANPIQELTQSIRKIAEKNYSQRIHFRSSSEFGGLADSFNTMAEKLEEYNNSNLAKLMKEKKRVETLINNMHDPLLGLDENKIIIFANEEALKILGLTETEVIGKDAKDLALHNDLVRSLTQEIYRYEEHPGKTEKQPMKIFADGKESYFEKEILNIPIVPTGEQTTQIIGHFIILRNITRYKELDFAKTNFIATVSHELKTPIASIRMSLQLLENEKLGTLNEEQNSLLLSIHDDIDRLLKITGELLNMTQVESGNIQLSVLPADSKEILNYAINATKTQAEQKKIKLEMSSSDNLPKVLADSEKTTWVLTNLISNAIRYSYENAIVFLDIVEEGSKVRISVRDTGQGIAPQYKDKIFDRYFRVPGTKKEGTGLGLSISKEFIEAQGGQITLESDIGAGSIFSILLNKAEVVS